MSVTFDLNRSNKYLGAFSSHPFHMEAVSRWLAQESKHGEVQGVRAFRVKVVSRSAEPQGNSVLPTK